MYYLFNIAYIDLLECILEIFLLLLSINLDYYNSDYDYLYWLLLLILLFLFILLLYTIDLFHWYLFYLDVSYILSIYTYDIYYSYYCYILDNCYSNSESYISSNELMSIDLSKQFTILSISYSID